MDVTHSFLAYLKEIFKTGFKILCLKHRGEQLDVSSANLKLILLIMSVIYAANGVVLGHEAMSILFSVGANILFIWMIRILTKDNTQATGIACLLIFSMSLTSMMQFFSLEWFIVMIDAFKLLAMIIFQSRSMAYVKDKT